MPTGVESVGLVEGIDRLAGALDALAAADPVVLGDGDTVTALVRAHERLGAVLARAAAAFDASGQWAADGARTSPAWVAAATRTPVAEARRRLRLGRALRRLPHAEAAWLAGDLGEAHVAALARADTPATEQALRRDEAMLVGHALALPFVHFQRVVAYWSQHADPDGADASHDRLHQARRLHLSQTFGGAWRLDGLLDPIAGRAVADALGRIETDLFAQDRADARTCVGDEPSPEQLPRTPAQRRADALLELARRAATAPADGRRPDPLFTVLVDHPTLAGRICELADGTVVAPAALVPWLNEAWIERVVFDGAGRPLDVGPHRRLFTGATRRAVEVRDRECFHPTCHEPAPACQIDHVHPWAAGGPTTVANGRLACPHHNRHRHTRTDRPP